jgi:AraC family transcriptional regulator
MAKDVGGESLWNRDFCKTHGQMNHPDASPPLVGRRLYLSSQDACWDGLRAVAFHEPVELDCHPSPASYGASLSLCAGGPRRFEQQQASSRRNAGHLGHGDLVLHTSESRLAEMRWSALSSHSMRTLHVRLSEDLLHRTAQEISDRDPLRSSLIERSRIQDPLLAQLGFALWEDLEQQSPSGRLYGETVARMLAVHLWRHHSSADVPALRERRHRLSERQVRRVADYVEACVGEDLSLGTLAQQAGLSPYHFARLFRHTTGQSPHQFVLCRRVETARRLLRETDLPLVLVAAKSGFADQSHFTRVFKRVIGITPGAYRAGAISYNEPQE